MICLIDVSGFVYRAFYALPSLTYNGQEVGAVYGFCAAINKITSLFKDSMFIAALDSSKKTFRNEIYSEYKANRKAMPEELFSQLPLIKEACEKFGFKIVEQLGFEADDIIATYSKKLHESRKVTVISSDKDLMQLLSLKNVSIYDPMKQKYIKDEDVMKKFGVSPDKVLDVLSLMGDSSDNIPGVPGIGPKTAASLINEYGSLDGIIKNLDSLPKNKKNETLKNEIEKALLSKKLASLKDDMDLDFEYSQTIPNGIDEFLLKFGFKSLVKKSNSPQQSQFFEKDLSINSENEIFLIAENFLENEIQRLRNILEDDKIIKICDDSKSIIKKCLSLGIDIKNTIDVSVMSYCISGTKIKHDVFSMSLEYLQKNSNDLCEIYKHLLSKLDDNTKFLFYEIENKLTKVLAKMEHLGIKIDTDHMAELENYFNEKIETLTKEIHKIAGFEFNIASPKQVSFALYEKLGFEKIGNKMSTDAGALSAFSGLNDGITDKIILWREYSKLQNSYVKSLLKLADHDHRVHTTYSQTVVNTGRLSSSDPNLQNIPARSEEGLKIRKSFIAEKGCKLISLDYSQMELRLLAHISNCENLINSFKMGADIHTSTAANIFKVSENDVTEEQRNVAKTINFSILYGISIHKLAQRLGVSRYDANKIYEEFMGHYPEILEYIKNTENFALQNGYSETIFKRKCFVPLIKSQNKIQVNFAKRQAVNAPIQGSNADIIKLAMVKIDEQKKIPFKILLQIHDELIIETPEDQVNKTLDFIKDIMENVVELSVHLKVDTKVSDHL